MDDKHFEQSLRKEVEELRIRPDSEVWENIAVALNKREGRRWFVVPFMWITASVLASVLFHTVLIQRPKDNGMHHVSPAYTGRAYPDKFSNKQMPGLKKGSVQPSPAWDTGIQAPHVVVMPLHRLQQPVAESGVAIMHAQQKARKDEPLNKPDALTDTGRSYAAENSHSPGTMPTDEKHVTAAFTTPLPTDTIAIVRQANNDSMQGTKDAVQQKGIETVMQKPSLQWQMIIAGGQNEPVFSHTLSSISGSFLNLAPSGLPVGQTPIVKNGITFGIGVSVSKQIGWYTGVQASLAYEYDTYGIGIGNRIDSSISIPSINRTNDGGFYYQSTNQNLYLNYYHFLRLGFSLYQDYHISRGISFRPYVGLGAAVLLGTNALHFDAGKSVLFQSRWLMRPVQATVSAGLDLSIGRLHSWYIGPSVSYFVTPVSQELYNNYLHLLQYKVRLTLPLIGKKK